MNSLWSTLTSANRLPGNCRAHWRMVVIDADQPDVSNVTIHLRSTHENLGLNHCMKVSLLLLIR